MDDETIKEISKEYGYELSPAEPHNIPKSTLWPIILAFGIIFFFWGFLTSLIISGVGAVIIVAGVAGWIEEFRS